MHRALTSSNACLLALICGSIELERRMQAKLEKQEVRYDARCAAPAADAPLRPQLWRYAARSMITARSLTAIVTPSASLA
jgi:hypothetical protein